MQKSKFTRRTRKIRSMLELGEHRPKRESTAFTLRFLESFRQEETRQ